MLQLLHCDDDNDQERNDYDFLFFGMMALMIHCPSFQANYIAPRPGKGKGLMTSLLEEGIWEKENQSKEGRMGFGASRQDRENGFEGNSTRPALKRKQKLQFQVF